MRANVCSFPSTDEVSTSSSVRPSARSKNNFRPCYSKDVNLFSFLLLAAEKHFFIHSRSVIAEKEENKLFNLQGEISFQITT